MNHYSIEKQNIENFIFEGNMLELSNCNIFSIKRINCKELIFHNCILEKYISEIIEEYIFSDVIIFEEMNIRNFHTKKCITKKLIIDNVRGILCIPYIENIKISNSQYFHLKTKTEKLDIYNSLVRISDSIKVISLYNAKITNFRKIMMIDTSVEINLLILIQCYIERLSGLGSIDTLFFSKCRIAKNAYIQKSFEKISNKYF